MTRAARWAVLLVCAAGCDGPSPIDAGLDARADAALDGGADAALPELAADAGADRYALVGEDVVLDGSGSVGAAAFRWQYGDGTGWDAPRAESSATVRYAEPGLYRAVLEVFDELGRRRVDGVNIRVTLPLRHTPAQSGSIAVWPSREELAVVSPDSAELTVFGYAGGAVSFVARHAVPAGPRSVAVYDGRWAVACPDAGAVALVAPDGAVERVDLGAARPFGVVASDGALFVTLQATGELARIEPSGGAYAEVARFAAIEDARGVAVLPGGRLAVTRWRSPDDAAYIASLAPDGSDLASWSLAYDPQAASDTESGGVPSYLEQVLVSPTGRLAAVPSLQAAIGEGMFVSGRPLTHETTLRAALSFLDPETGVEDFGARKLFDDRGLASAGVFSSHGDLLYVAMRGNRTIERRDLLAGTQAGTISEVGYALQGVALSPDDRLLFVDAYLSRELVVYDVHDPNEVPMELARLPIVASEPLSPEVLRGKQLFNDAADERIGRDGYIACAHCHLDGLADGRTWDFTDRGEGLRNTIELIGRAGIGDGPLHWSANFDEVQDFEHDMRGPFRGLGLMSDAELHTGTRDTTLGDPKAGVSADLDALAAYVSSLATEPPSPHRNEDGTLTATAERGRLLFEGAGGCTTCHTGPRLTDSALSAPGVVVLHDVGTLGAGSGMRLGMPLTGLDTPTLHGLFRSAPYLHDGSARTLHDVMTTRNATDRHGTTSAMSAGELDDLVAYLLCLDGRVD
ncbi:MAG: PKD domain-containing protein [Sandaracinaceae bacterium]